MTIQIKYSDSHVRSAKRQHGTNDGNAVHKTILGILMVFALSRRKRNERSLARPLERAHGEKLVKKSLEAGISAVAINKEHGIM